MSLFEKHEQLLKKSIGALHSRTFFAAFAEHPSPSIYGETADADGQSWFKASLGKSFTELKQTGSTGQAGEEESPYLQEKLKIVYPISTIESLITNSKQSFNQWRKVSVDDRAGILLESLERVKGRFFEIAYATMHTTGQGFMMAFHRRG